jgi:hypothetical protein
MGGVVITVFTLLFLAAAYLFLRRVGIKRVAYRRFFSETGVYESETVQLVEEISNRFFLPLFKVDVDAYLPNELCLSGHAQAAYGMQAFTNRYHVLPPFTRVRRGISVDCAKRGFYTLDSVYIGGRFAVLHPAKTALYVYPRALPAGHSNPLENAVLNTEASARRLFEDPFNFAGVRDYRPGDPFRSINHKSTAKTGALKVNERDFFSNRSFMVYIDFNRLPAPEPLTTEAYEAYMERALSYAADMVFKSVHLGYSVGFAANCKMHGQANHVRFPMGRGQAHYLEILQAMASIRLSDGCSFAWLLKQDIDDVWHADIYIITVNEHDETLDALAGLYESKGNHVTVITLRNE